MNSEASIFMTWSTCSGSVAVYLVAIAEGKCRRKLLISVLSLVGGLLPTLYYHPEIIRFVLAHAGFESNPATDAETPSELTLLSLVVPLFFFGLAGFVWIFGLMTGSKAKSSTRRSLDACLPLDVEVDPDEWVLAENIPFRKSRRRKRLKTGCDWGY